MDELKVITLTEDNVKDFATKMPSHGLIFIAFLAPWCGHCQTFKPEWEKIQEHLKQNKNKCSGHIITVDDINMKHLPCKQPSGFPTLSLYNGTEHKENYGGSRSKDELISYLLNIMTKPKKHIKKKMTKRKRSSLTGGGCRTFKRRRRSSRSSKKCKKCRCKRCKCKKCKKCRCKKCRCKRKR